MEFLEDDILFQQFLQNEGGFLIEEIQNDDCHPVVNRFIMRRWIICEFFRTGNRFCDAIEILEAVDHGILNDRQKILVMRKKAMLSKLIFEFATHLDIQQRENRLLDAVAYHLDIKQLRPNDMTNELELRMVREMYERKVGAVPEGFDI